MSSQGPRSGPAKALLDADPETSVDELDEVLADVTVWECQRCGRKRYAANNQCRRCGGEKFRKTTAGGER